MSARAELEELGARLTSLMQSEKEKQKGLQNAKEIWDQHHSDMMTTFETLNEKFAGLTKTLNSHDTGGTTTKDAYVLLLVNGHTHHFTDDLVRANGKGGPRAAALLNKYIREDLAQQGTLSKNSNLMVRVYANTKELSKDAWRAKLVDPSPRSLAAFAAGFSQDFVHFDFVDVGDKIHVDVKISGALHYYVQDPACRQVYLGTSHGEDYTKVLKTYSDKVALVIGDIREPWNVEFKSVAFPTVFRMSKPPVLQTFKPSAIAARTARPESMRQGSGVCLDFQHRVCTRSGCKLDHVSTTNGGSTSKYSVQTIEDMDANYGNVSKPQTEPSKPRVSTTSQFWNPTSGRIPVNEDGHRVETSTIRRPTETEWGIYKAAFKTRKPCNNFQLRGKCSNPTCTRDHGRLDPAARHTLRYLLKEIPCKERGGCRKLECYNAHSCWKHRCRTGKTRECNLPLEMHLKNREVLAWVGPAHAAHVDETDDIDNGMEWDDAWSGAESSEHGVHPTDFHEFGVEHETGNEAGTGNGVGMNGHQQAISYDPDEPLIDL